MDVSSFDLKFYQFWKTCHLNFKEQAVWKLNDNVVRSTFKTFVIQEYNLTVTLSEANYLYKASCNHDSLK